MATTASSVTSAGTYLANGSFDEVTFNTATPTIVNLLTYSQDLSNIAWDKITSGTGTIPVVTPNFALAPDGTLTASKVDYASGGNGQSTVANGGISNPTVGITRTFSVWMRTLAGTTGVTLFNGDEVSSVIVTTDWQRFSYTRTTVSTNAYGVRLSKREIWGTGGTASVLIWGAQWELGSTASIYQPIAAANTLVATGVKAKTAADGTVYVSGSYDEVTYNTTNVNLLQYSEQLNNSAWSKNAVTIAPNNIIAPDGTFTADKIQETAVTSFFAVVQNPAGIVSKPYTISFYAKAGERSQVVVSFTVSTAYVMYNLATGTITTSSGLYLTGSSITFVGNGWYYCTASLTTLSSGSNLLYFIIALANSSSDTYAGTAGFGAYVWGTQLEQNTKATAYQLTPPVSPPPILYNLVPSYTNTMTAANGWGVGPNTAFVGSTTAPDGSATAVTYTGNGSGANEFIVKGITYTANTTYTASVWARLSGGTVPTNGTILTISYHNGTVETRSTVPYSGNLTSTWQRFSTTYTNINAGTYSAFFAADQTNTANIDIWGAQVEQGNTATIYQGISAPNTLVTGFAKRDTQSGITYVTDEFDDFTKILPVTNGLILNLDATTYSGSTTWQNQTVNSYNATLVNNPAYSSVNGGIIQFNGTQQYATTNIPSSTFTPSSNWTMSTWVRFNATNNSLAYLNPRPDGLGYYGTSGNILGCVYYGNYGLFWTTLVTNGVRGFYAGSQVRTGPVYAESNIQTSNLTFGVWYNITGVYDYTGNSHKLYVNGALVNTTTVITTGTFQNFASVPYIVSGSDGVYGGSSSGRSLDGDLGQNLIYNRALSAQEVLDNYNALKGRYSSFNEFTGKVVDGLVAYYDPAYSSSYSGVGASLYNLVDGVAATLNGTYSASTAAVGSSVSDTQTIRLTNSDLVTATNNISHIQAPSFTNITTVSIWFYQHTYNGISRYILDGRTGGSEGWIYNGSIGSNWSTGITYVNGGASSGTPSWNNWGGGETGVWKNVTFIANTPFTDDINIFSRYTDNEGLDVTFGAILIYNRVLTQAENAQNFNALRGRFGI